MQGSKTGVVTRAMKLKKRNELEAKQWKVTIKFNNTNHQQVARINYTLQRIKGDTKVRAFVDTRLLQKVDQLKWKGFGLWAQHQPVTVETQFDDLNYQRKPDGTLELDNEDHNCQYRAVLVPLVQEKQCVVCLNQQATRSLPCMHYCMCEKCFKAIERCPVCRKRKTAQ